MRRCCVLRSELQDPHDPQLPLLNTLIVVAGAALVHSKGRLEAFGPAAAWLADCHLLLHALCSSAGGYFGQEERLAKLVADQELP